MSKKFIFTAISIAVITASGLFIKYRYNYFDAPSSKSESIPEQNQEVAVNTTEANHPFSIEYMRKQEYPGSEFTIGDDLTNGSNYSRYIASYNSEGLKQYGLLTIPNGDMPETGWPAIVFLHGYIDPDVYNTTDRYTAYQDGFARNGYVTFKIDYRGNGNSEGTSHGGQEAPDYTIDALNAFTSLQKDDRVDANRIGMWGHSMGGSILVRAMVINPDVKAGVSWAGVVGLYEQVPRQWFDGLIATYGEPDNASFWRSISPIYHLEKISGPVQLHHATGDASQLP